jgi:glutamyl-tRNA reductase
LPEGRTWIMKIVAIGLNHTSAPIEVRERLAFTASQTDSALQQLRQRFPECEFTVLSTCNRVEVYTVGDREGWEDGSEIIRFLAETKNLSVDTLRDYVYVHVDSRAVEHLLEVASGLDSLVVGESQIIGQVKEGYRQACAAKTTGKVLNRLFHSAFATGKEVQSSTQVACGRVSVAGVAIELAQQLFAHVDRAAVLVVGAGQMGELLIKHLLHVDCKDITIVNRTFCRAKSMAQQYGVKALPWEELGGQFARVDIVIGSAAGEDHLIDKESFKAVARQRHHRPLLIVDIAVPRNFDPAIGELENTYLFSVDDLSDVALQNRKAREKDIAAGHEIVRANAAEFIDWFEICDLGPQIGELTAALTQISQKELDRFFVGDREHAACRDTLRPMVNRVVNKILHCFIRHVNATARELGKEEATKIMDQVVKQAQQLAAEENH